MSKARIARPPRPIRPDLSAYTDYRQFTEPELIAELVWMHDLLQIMWGCAWRLSPIDWQMLEEISSQLDLLQQRLADIGVGL
jgi:hypothetical protein